MKFKVGQKVRICKYDGFEIGITGTISFPPKESFFIELFGNNYFRELKTSASKEISVWIVFDKVHYDGDGDGPYSETEINTKYLEIIDEQKT